MGSPTETGYSPVPWTQGLGVRTVLAILIIFTVGVRGEDDCQTAKESFDACNDDAEALLAEGTCTLVTNLGTCITRLAKDCPSEEQHLLKKTKKLVVRAESGNRNYDERTCPGAVSLKKQYPFLDCSKVSETFSVCHGDAWQKFLKQRSLGEDGRPDWIERKICNWITDTFQDCHDVIDDTLCMTHKDLNMMVDRGLHSILGSLVATSKNWDSAKCPTAVEHQARWQAMPKGSEFLPFTRFPSISGSSGLTLSVYSLILAFSAVSVFWF